MGFLTFMVSEPKGSGANRTTNQAVEPKAGYRCAANRQLSALSACHTAIHKNLYHDAAVFCFS